MNSRATNTLILPCSRFTPAQIQEMFSLHGKYFTNISFDKFLTDFNEKQWCILIRNQQQEIVGYSTIQLITRTIAKIPVLVLFSGDTLVATEYRHFNALMPAFVKFCEYLERMYAACNRYWLLITKGYRTYRLIPVNYVTFYPNRHSETPWEIRQIIDVICKEKFGERYKADSGIIKSDSTHDFLKPEFAEIPAGRERNPDVQFFLSNNPGYLYGDELVCLTPISTGNLVRSSFRRYLRECWNPTEE